MTPDGDKNDGRMPLGSPPAKTPSARGRAARPAADDLLDTMQGRARHQHAPAALARARALTWLTERPHWLAVTLTLSVLIVVVALVAYATARGSGVWVLVAALGLAVAAAALVWSRSRSRAATFASSTRRDSPSPRGPSVTPDVTPDADDFPDRPAPATLAAPGVSTAPALTLQSITTRGRLSKRSALVAAAAVCREVTTPGARAIVAGAELARLTLPPVRDLTVRQAGASALIKDTEVTVGRPEAFTTVDDELISRRADPESRTLLVGWDGQAQAAFVLVATD